LSASLASANGNVLVRYLPTFKLASQRRSLCPLRRRRKGEGRRRGEKTDISNVTSLLTLPFRLRWNPR
jgi:hypothetical protein